MSITKGQYITQKGGDEIPGFWTPITSKVPTDKFKRDFEYWFFASINRAFQKLSKVREFTRTYCVHLALKALNTKCSQV